MLLIWSLTDTFIVFWQPPTNYSEHVKEGFDHFQMLSEGFAIMGVVVTVCFACCIGMLVSAGTEWPELKMFEQSQKIETKNEGRNLSTVVQKEEREKPQKRPERKDSRLLG